MSKIYVGNLNYKTAEAELEEFFSSFGNVTKADVIRDRGTGRSKGFAFVEFDEESSAKKAIEEGNGKELQGRPLRVNEARQDQQGGGGRRGGGGGGGGGRHHQRRERSEHHQD